jgi:hypothetical protein
MNDQELDQLPKRTRIAVVATCVEHVLDLYRLGNFKLLARHAKSSAIKAPPDEDLPQHALGMAWAFVESGALDPAAIKAVLDGLMQNPEGFDPEDMCPGGVVVLGCVGGTLRAMQDETPAQAKKTLRSCGSAVWDGLVDAIDDDDEAKRCADAEKAWQPRVLERAQQRADKPLSRADFADLLAQPPEWRSHLDAYRKYYA